MRNAWFFFKIDRDFTIENFLKEKEEEEEKIGK